MECGELNFLMLFQKFKSVFFQSLQAGVCGGRIMRLYLQKWLPVVVQITNFVCLKSERLNIISTLPVPLLVVTNFAR